MKLIGGQRRSRALLACSLVLAGLLTLALPSASVPSTAPAVVIAPGVLGVATVTAPGPSLAAASSGPSEFFLFQAGMNTSDWSGTLARLALFSDTDDQVQIGDRLWEAGALLEAGDRPPSLTRRIYTSHRDPQLGQQTTALAWSALTDDQRALLDRNPAQVDLGSDGLGELRLAYLRGDRSLEAGHPKGVFRQRASLLADAIHSTLVFVGAPAAGVQGGSAYADFLQQHAARRRTVYLGANDGMLHAFDAGDGTEVFAYVPNALMGALNQLTRLAFTHRAYVDGGATAAEVRVADDWKTVLVSGMGGGAQGVFALDVSDPDHFADSGAVWEFTDEDDPAMGNLLAAPGIGKFRIGRRDGVTAYRYFAVLTSGLNNYVDDGKGRFIARAAGALFLLALDKPAGQAWKRGVNYYRLETTVPDPAAAHALGAPTLVTGGDGAVAYIYMGDLQGNLWCVDVTGATGWYGGKGTAPARRLVFVARDGEGQRQPITGQVRVAFAPDGGYLILFGTGKFIEQADNLPPSFRPQSFYAVRDMPDSTPNPLGGRSTLAARELRNFEGQRQPLRLSGEPFSYTGPQARQGWYLDFPDTAQTGERSVSNPVLAAGKVFFNTLLPGMASASGPGARSYAVDSLTGLSFDGAGVVVNEGPVGQWLPAGVLAPPMVLAWAGNADAPSPGGATAAGQPVVVLNAGAPTADGSGVVATKVATVAAPAGRLGWREVSNWRDLHDDVAR